MAHGIERLREYHVEALVEPDLLAGPERAHFPGRAPVHPHLAAAGEHVDRPVVARFEEDAEAGRRLRQPVDLFLQRDDLVARLAESSRQPFVLTADCREVDLSVTQALLERPDLTGRIGQPPPEHRDLFLEEGDLRGEVSDLLLMPRGAYVVFASCHAQPPFREPTFSRPYLSRSLPSPAPPRL